jgi:hypothetical protein
VVPGKQSIPLEQIDLPVTFRDASNYRTETLTFEVVDFSRPYHIKFMAIPGYTYLKLKMLRPTGIITMEAMAQRALAREQDNIKLVVAAVAATELKELCRDPQPRSPDPAMPSTSGTFKFTEDARSCKLTPRI